MTSIFKDKKPSPYGDYYITNGKSGIEAINSIVTVSDTKVVFKTIYKDKEYKEIELTNPISLEPDRNNGSYYFENIDMGSYKVNIVINYTKNGMGPPYVSIRYFDLKNDFIDFIDSPQGIDNVPRGFILPQRTITTTLAPTPMTSIFKDIEPLPYGDYYITNGKSGTEAINSIVTVSREKVVFKTIYKDQEYKEIELTNPISLKPERHNGSYYFDGIKMGSYKVNIVINYTNDNGIGPPYVSIVYFDLKNDFIDAFKSPQGIDSVPRGFILPQRTLTSTLTTTLTTTLTPKPTTPEKSFLDKYLISIVLFTLVLLSAIALGVFFLIRNRKAKISK